MKIWKIAQEDYVGQHSAPNKENGVPLHDLGSMYPEDIYSFDAVRLYSTGNPSDSQCIAIIQMAKGRPHASVKVYRAVPDYNYDINKEIRTFNKLLGYYYQFKFFPMDNAIIDKLDEKYPINQHDYDDRLALIEADIENHVQELESQKQPTIRINNGDWVTISRDYAKEHGLSNLNGKFKILSKTVRASQVFNDGDSIQEWGYIL